MLNRYLEETEYLNYSHPLLDGFAQELPRDKVEKAKTLYLRVRDGFLYDPYHLDLRKPALTASNIATRKRAWCVEKAILLAALFRKLGFPAKLGYAVVTNHLGVEKLTRYLRREEIVFHGFVEVFLEGIWVKCTPAFDARICRVSGVTPLEWDGRSDSMFQAYDGGRSFMEYKHFYGTFEDVPLELMNTEMKAYYPHLFEQIYNTKEFSFRHLWTLE
jgi:transglutaminase-like putative cysteine protease